MPILLLEMNMLDDYPKNLDLVFDVLRKEKPFDYFFHRFDVVSPSCFESAGYKGSVSDGSK